MFYEKPVFAELFGLVIFDLKRLAEFQQRHNINQDLLDAFTTTELGTQVSEQGVSIPITNIEGEYYNFAVSNLLSNERYLADKQIVVRSSGWILESTSGEIIVCGIGYFKQFDENIFLKTEKFIRLSLTPGWNEITIVGGTDDESRLVYEILTNPVSSKPVFLGNFEDSFSLID